MMIPKPAMRPTVLSFALAALVLVPLTPGVAQDDDIDGSISRPVVQPLPSRGSYELNAALTRLAANPRDVNALIDAGNAAMELGDSEAAMGFLGRADQLSPANPRVKATLASAMVRNENPYDAIPLFEAAERAGATDAMLAGDRGLAYDLVGDNPSAQRFYRQALAALPSGEARDEIVRRLALSQAIEGDRKGFEATLLPQLRSPDTAAWRSRAFGLAILGDEAEAVKIAYGTMSRDLADAMAPYLRYMIRLTPAQQAAAANFGHFPRAAQIGRDDPRAAVFSASIPRRPRTADAGLIPEGKALGGKAAEKTDSAKASRKRKRDTRVAVAAPAAAVPRPVPTPAPTPAPVQRPAPTVRIAAATPPPPAFKPPTIFTPAASPTPAPSAKPAPQPSLSLTPAPTPSPTPSPSPAPVQLAVAAPPPAVTAAASPAPGQTPTPSSPVGTPTPSSFDLAVLAQKLAETAPLPATSLPATSPPANSPPVSPPAVTAPAAAAPAPARLRLSDAFSDFRPPEDEARTAVAAVDIGKIVPARQKATDAKSAALADERGPLPGTPSGTRRSAAVETLASAKALKAAGADKAKSSAPTHPSRIWIQLAAGRDKTALGFDWRKLTRALADLFKAKKGWTTPWGQTNRLLVGPFESQAAAATFLKELKKKDADAFVWTSPAGQAIDALATK